MKIQNKKNTQFSIFYRFIIHHKKYANNFLTYSLHFQVVDSDKVSHTHNACKGYSYWEYVILSLNAEFLRTFSNFRLRFHVRIRLRRLVY